VLLTDVVLLYVSRHFLNSAVSNVCGCLIHRIATITAKSFQEIDIEYSLVWESTDSTAALPFEIDRRFGSLTLKRVLKYIIDPHQYRMIVTAREPASQIESKVLVSKVMYFMLYSLNVFIN